MLDAGVEDGAVWWSTTCTGPLPGPDGGYCAWEWLDGSAQWAPCPPDGGTLCPGYAGDGAAARRTPGGQPERGAFFLYRTTSERGSLQSVSPVFVMAR